MLIRLAERNSRKSRRARSVKHWGIWRMGLEFMGYVHEIKGTKKEYMESKATMAKGLFIELCTTCFMIVIRGWIWRSGLERSDRSRCICHHLLTRQSRDTRELLSFE